MARSRVDLDSRGIEELLKDEGVADHLEMLMTPVLQAAIQGAPVDSGDYRDSIELVVEFTDRAVARVAAYDHKAHIIEARTGNLARALGVLGGVEDEREMVDYRRRDGVVIRVTRAQAHNYSRGRQG